MRFEPLLSFRMVGKFADQDTVDRRRSVANQLGRGRVIGDADDETAEILLRVEAVECGGFDDGVDGCGAFAGNAREDLIVIAMSRIRLDNKSIGLHLWFFAQYVPLQIVLPFSAPN